jgi:NADH-quinone oxidoreductase subunit N
MLQSGLNLGLFWPEISLVIFAVAVVLLDLFIERKGLLALVSIVGLLVSCGLAVALWGETGRSAFYGLLAVDNFALFFKVLFLGIAVLVILASNDYVSNLKRFQGEYYALILLATVGAMLMAAANELISLFIALELLNLSMYSLVGFLKNERSTEAALKYLLLSGVASAVLLFGMALVYGFTGQTQLVAIAASIQKMPVSDLLANPGLILGVVLMVAGFGFKIGAVPFHMWIPDVYEGAPTPITAFLSVGSKSAGFAIILRIFYSAFQSPSNLSLDWGTIFAVLAALTMTVGNIVAIQQSNIKRMLGYSSIAQAGYVMVGLATVGLSPVAVTTGQSSILFFLASYSLTNLGAFIAVIAICNRISGEGIEDFRGMGKRAPVLSMALTLCLISLIGMPPAAGFMAKFYVFGTAIQHNLLWLVVIAVLNSVISAYYYLRVVKVMWTGEPASEEKVASSAPFRLALGLSCLGVLVFGILPGLGMKIAEIASRIF